MLLGAFTAQAQLRNADVYEVTEMDHSMQRNVVTIPGFDGYQTLKCDFHIHTAFSDGSVWPDMRVEEAWQEGLDAIAITDHIEYRPHKELLKGDLNESFKIAKKRGDELGFVVIHGSEITRSKPLGHLNALFLQDIMDQPEKYRNKTVSLKGKAITKSRSLKNGYFYFGRDVMTCCANDIRFIPLAAEAADTSELKNLAWYKLTARIDVRTLPDVYEGPGPVLHTVSIEPCAVPEQEVATFY